MPQDAPEITSLPTSAQPNEWTWPRLLVPLAAPIIWLIQGAAAVLTSPPVWQTSADPAYVYLVNSAELATGQATFANQHPGTPLYWLMAATDWLVHLTTGLGSSLAADVVARPETFLAAAAVVLVVLQALGLAAFGLVFTRWFGLGAALLGQALVLASQPLLSTAVTPVALQVAVGLFLLAAVGRSWDGSRPDASRWRLVLVGVLIALGLTAKLTFYPALLLPLLLFRPRQLVTVYASGAIFGVLFVLITVRSELLDGLVWWRNFFLTSGRTPGDTNQRGLASALTDLPGTLLHVIPIVLVVVVAAVICFVLARGSRLAIHGTWSPSRALASALLVTAAALVTTLKVFYPQDLLVVPLVSAAALAVVWGWLAVSTTSRTAQALAWVVPAVGLVVAAAWSSVSRTESINDQGASPEALALAQFMDETKASGTPVASAYGVFSPGTALYFGMWLSQRSLAPEITAVWPNYVDYKLENGRFYYFTDIGEVEFTCNELSDLINSPTGLLWVPGRDVTFMTDQPQYTSISVEPYKTFGDLGVYRFSDITCPS